MRRLAVAAVALALIESGCKPREKVHLEPTKEAASLASTVHMADPSTEPQLIRGFHQIEQKSWRWTERSFSVVLRPPHGAEKSGARLVARISFPDILMEKVRPVTLEASVSGVRIGSATYSAPGEYTFEADLPQAAVGNDAITIDFQVNKFLPAGSLETRELGLIANSIGLEPK